MIVSIDKQVPPFDSYAAERTRGLYNVDVEDGQRFRLDVDVPVESFSMKKCPACSGSYEPAGSLMVCAQCGNNEPSAPWQIGVVVGPSGSGKSSILQELAKNNWHEPDFVWEDVPIIEALGGGHDQYAKATAALAAVGLGSVPSWLRPRSVLSMGEGFRADMARLLLSTQFPEAQVLLDEFTSVLDRQVAKVGSGAFAKAWRRVPGRRIVLFTPHYDVLDWIQPDWWVDTAEGLDEFAADRGVVQAREGDFQEASHRARYRGDRVATLEC